MFFHKTQNDLGLQIPGPFCVNWPVWQNRRIVRYILHRNIPIFSGTICPMNRLTRLILLTVIFLTACQPAATPPAPTVDISAASTQAVATIMAGITQTAQFVPPTPVPTATPVPVPTAIRTPPALPPIFTTDLLNPLDTPHIYIHDTCQYLKTKWNPNNAAPGTVVMVIMIHGIVEGDPSQPQDISKPDFKKLLSDLKAQNFSAINTQQLFDFLYYNAKIPQRSVVLLQDDRKTAQNFNEIFRPAWEKWGWFVVNAWINADDSIYTQRIQENVALEKEGWVDHQSHGYVHNIPMNDNSSDEYLKGELLGSMEKMQRDFGKTPIAIIWPTGAFGKRPVAAARQYGYKLGFTVNPRGPLLFNWVPQADKGDDMRPSYIPEGPAADPLMTLPRYWDTDARAHLDTVRNISKAAAAYAESVKATELEYYDIACAPTYGQIPQP